MKEPLASQTFTRVELERDDELADRIALELAKLRPRTSARRSGCPHTDPLARHGSRVQLGWTGMLVATMTDTQSRTTRRRAEDNRASPTVPAGSEPAGTGADREDVTELREVLRAGERGYRAYLTELRQGDVEPVEDWSTWYAEYLLGLR